MLAMLSSSMAMIAILSLGSALERPYAQVVRRSFKPRINPASHCGGNEYDERDEQAGKPVGRPKSLFHRYPTSYNRLTIGYTSLKFQTKSALDYALMSSDVGR